MSSREANTLHNACFDNLLNCGHYLIMVANKLNLKVWSTSNDWKEGDWTKSGRSGSQSGRRKMHSKSGRLPPKAVEWTCLNADFNFQVRPFSSFTSWGQRPHTYFSVCSKLRYFPNWWEHGLISKVQEKNPVKAPTIRLPDRFASARISTKSWKWGSPQAGHFPTNGRNSPTWGNFTLCRRKYILPRREKMSMFASVFTVAEKSHFDNSSTFKTNQYSIYACLYQHPKWLQ